MTGTIAELNWEMTQSRKVFREVDERLMKLGLEQSLKYIINIPSVEFNLSSEEAEKIKGIYSGVSILAKEIGIDTSEYDLKFNEELNRYTRT
ncbi:hypothetical protein COU57_04250 [Candidatus Pacearchaeota archaeon CG10_big_fil_rev_8_21_14_0_10_32_14]|nr:MAG: hypothetical protein COU57_04250 [Candidatus Pacearchaeota archaeon CG10_big_fil_rev_8_21_14_0_10_32_14]